MVFKGRFFSSKKHSGASSPDGGSNTSSPRTPTSESPSRSEKKKVRSSPEGPPPDSTGRQAKIQQQQQKKNEKDKEKDERGKEDSKRSTLTGAASAPAKIWKAKGIKEGAAAAGSSLSPFLPSSHGLRRIKTRSGPLPQEAFSGHVVSGIGSSNLSREGSCSAVSSNSALELSSSSSALCGVGNKTLRKKDMRGLEKVPESHVSSWADQRSQFDRSLQDVATLGTPMAYKMIWRSKLNYDSRKRKLKPLLPSSRRSIRFGSKLVIGIVLHPGTNQSPPRTSSRTLQGRISKENSSLETPLKRPQCMPLTSWISASAFLSQQWLRPSRGSPSSKSQIQ